MFYLKTFYQSIWDLKLRGISFVLLSLGILILAGNDSIISNSLLVKPKAQTPYFNALLDHKINTNGIVRKMKNLPGVVNVTVKSSVDLENDVKKMVRDLDQGVVDNLLQVKYQGIKVELERSLETRGQKLIQEYLNRLVGSETITMTGVRVPKVIISDEDSLKVMLMKWVDLFVVLCLCVVWTFASWTCGKNLRKRSYLIEKFQRKKAVGVKAFAFGMTPIYLLTVAIEFIFNFNLNLTLVTIVFVASLAIGFMFNTQKLIPTK